MEDGLVVDGVNAVVLSGVAEDVAEDLAGEFELRPLLERILRRSVELLGGDAGSICSVDEAAGFYRKEADFGVACQSGQVFPLDRGDDRRGGAGPRAGRSSPTTAPSPAATSGPRTGRRCAAWSASRSSGAAPSSAPAWCSAATRTAASAPTDSARLELFARHAAIALANARLYQEAEAHARAEAAAAERDRLVREVHDTVAQGLASVIVHLDAAARERRPDRRRSTGPGSRPSPRWPRPAVPSWAWRPRRWRAGRWPRRWSWSWAGPTAPATWTSGWWWPGRPEPLPDGLAHQLFRIAQEALTNAVRHAGARSVRIGVLHEDGAVAVLVQDDGQGSPPAETRRLDRPARDAPSGPG